MELDGLVALRRLIRGSSRFDSWWLHHRCTVLAMSQAVDRIIDEVGQLSDEERAELLDRLGAFAPSMPLPGVAGCSTCGNKVTGPHACPGKPRVGYDVILEGYADPSVPFKHRVDVAQLLRDLGFPMQDACDAAARTLCLGGGVTAARNVPLSEAEDLRGKFMAAGAKVQLTIRGDGGPG